MCVPLKFRFRGEEKINKQITTLDIRVCATCHLYGLLYDILSLSKNNLDHCILLT